MAHALGAEVRVYLVDLRTLGDGMVRALGLAHVAVDAGIDDLERHGLVSA
jgi:hypothetical protein